MEGAEGAEGTRQLKMCGAAILVINHSTTDLCISRWWDKKQAPSWEKLLSGERQEANNCVVDSLYQQPFSFLIGSRSSKHPSVNHILRPIYYLPPQRTAISVAHGYWRYITRWSRGIKDGKALDSYLPILSHAKGSACHLQFPSEGNRIAFKKFLLQVDPPKHYSRVK